MGMPEAGAGQNPPQAATVHVGIVVFNSLLDLPACLAGLGKQTYPALTLTICDNASTDGGAAWLREHAASRANLISNPTNIGFAAAHNQILASCRPSADDFYMPLNPDVSLEPGYITALVDACLRTSAGWATGKLRLPGAPDGAPRIYSAGHALRRDGYALNIGYLLPDNGRFDAEREVFGAPGAAPLISGRLIADLAPDGQLFDADLFMYGEDVDLDWRARRQGWRCWYVPEALASHRGSQSATGRENWRRLALGNRYLSAIKNASLVDLLTYNLPLVAVHCAIRMLATPRHGAALIARLMRLAPRMVRKRRRARLARAEMLAWFRWADDQPTGQPLSWQARLADARRHWRGPA